MGYRPYIYIKEKGDSSAIELYKFYGYVELDGLESIKWLSDHKKLECTDIFNYAGFGPDIEFTASEFREWFDLYQKDVVKYRKSNNLGDDDTSESIFDEHPGLREIYLDARSKIVWWG